MLPRASQVQGVIASAGSGMLVGALCLVVGAVAALFSGDWAIAFPDEGVASRLWLVFLGVGLIGGLLFAPDVIWLNQRGRSAAWLFGAAAAGALIGGFTAFMCASPPYTSLLRGVLVAPICGALAGAMAAARILTANAASGRNSGAQ
jgi:hypothetical protein